MGSMLWTWILPEIYHIWYLTLSIPTINVIMGRKKVFWALLAKLWCNIQDMLSLILLLSPLKLPIQGVDSIRLTFKSAFFICLLLFAKTKAIRRWAVPYQICLQGSGLPLMKNASAHPLCICVCAQWLSPVWLFTTPRTVNPPGFSVHGIL